MGWTDERVELLKKLWQDGLSASQIAKQLGGVTRNAVIGKVTRLGLGGRAKPSTPMQRAPKPMPVLAPPRAPRLPVPRYDPPPTALVVPLRPRAEGPGLATVLTLQAHMCKWPIGDPLLASFSHCGRRREDAGPYCREHAAVAYQPPSTKKKHTAAELARSLRRYV